MKKKKKDILDRLHDEAREGWTEEEPSPGGLEKVLQAIRKAKKK